MSSIFPTSPLAAPIPHAAASADAAPPLAVTPTQNATSTSDKGDATSFSGSGGGSGSSSQADSVALMLTRVGSRQSRPSDATSTSVINAQAHDNDTPPPFGSNMPKVEMPDPLPTSPFLKRN